MVRALARTRKKKKCSAARRITSPDDSHLTQSSGLDRIIESTQRKTRWSHSSRREPAISAPVRPQRDVLEQCLSDAASGSARAMNQLGILYYNGCSIAQNRARAVAWFARAAALGHAGAQNNLGVCYMLGRGVAAHPGLAMRWLECAALQGHKPALDNLARCHVAACIPGGGDESLSFGRYSSSLGVPSHDIRPEAAVAQVAESQVERQLIVQELLHAT
jgi:TPR repeat protein